MALLEDLHSATEAGVALSEFTTMFPLDTRYFSTKHSTDSNVITFESVASVAAPPSSTRNDAQVVKRPIIKSIKQPMITDKEIAAGYDWYKVQLQLSTSLPDLLSSGRKAVTTDDWNVALQQIQFENTLKNLKECRNSGLWSFKQITRQSEPEVSSHWNVVIQSAVEMSIDFHQENRWKLATAYTFAHEIASGINVLKSKLRPVQQYRQIFTLTMYLASLEIENAMDIDVTNILKEPIESIPITISNPDDMDVDALEITNAPETSINKPSTSVAKKDQNHLVAKENVPDQNGIKNFQSTPITLNSSMVTYAIPSMSSSSSVFSQFKNFSYKLPRPDIIVPISKFQSIRITLPLKKVGTPSKWIPDQGRYTKPIRSTF